MKVLVVGMNPSGRDLKHKKGPTLDRLESWMNQVNVKHFSFMNTFDEPGETKLTKVDFKRLCKVTQSYDKIIALGVFVSSALNTINVSHFKMPHPSPLNRLLNDKAFEAKIISECKDYLK